MSMRVHQSTSGASEATLRFNVLNPNPGLADFMINGRHFTIIFDPMNQEGSLTFDYSEHHFFIIAPITCTDTLTINAKTVFVLNKVEAAAGIVFNCSKKVVSFVDLAEAIDTKNLSKCEIFNSELVQLQKQLHAIREPIPDMKEIFKGIMKCWEYQLTEGEECRYLHGLAFFSIYKSIQLKLDAGDSQFYTIDTKKAPTSAPKNLPPRIESHFKNCAHCLPVYEELSDLAKEMMSLRYNLENFALVVRDLPKDARIARQQLEKFGVLEASDLKLPIYNPQVYYGYAEIVKLLDNSRAKLAAQIADTSQEDMMRLQQISDHYLASK